VTFGLRVVRGRWSWTVRDLRVAGWSRSSDGGLDSSGRGDEVENLRGAGTGWELSGSRTCNRACRKVRLCGAGFCGVSCGKVAVSAGIGLRFLRWRPKHVRGRIGKPVLRRREGKPHRGQGQEGTVAVLCLGGGSSRLAEGLKPSKSRVPSECGAERQGGIGLGNGFGSSVGSTPCRSKLTSVVGV
jgi:hypothetical protein